MAQSAGRLWRFTIFLDLDAAAGEWSVQGRGDGSVGTPGVRCALCCGVRGRRREFAAGGPG